MEYQMFKTSNITKAVLLTSLFFFQQVHADDNAPQIIDLQANELVKLVQQGDISIANSAQNYLNRIKQYSNLNAFISTNPAATLQQAKNFDSLSNSDKRKGKLYGVFISVKDNIDVKEFPITGGTPALKNHYPKKDAEIIDKLKKEGAIIIGKTNLHELAFGITGKNAFYGTVKNAYDQNYFAGGSSSGAAVSVAAKMIPIAIGTDTGGSVRIPASFMESMVIDHLLAGIQQMALFRYLLLKILPASSLNQQKILS